MLCFITYNEGVMLQFFDAIQQVLQPIISLLSPLTFGLTGLDFLILAIIIFYAYEGYSLGFVLAFSDLVSFILSFILALKLYGIFGQLLIAVFAMPAGFANAIGFFIVALASEIILSLLFRKLLHKIPPIDPDSTIRRIFTPFDHVLGLIPGILSAFIILAFLLSVVIALPSSPYLKKVVTGSKIGSHLVANTATVEKGLNDVFGGALQDSLTFLTVKPDSGERVDLNFSVTNGLVDEAGEQAMLEAVNNERAKLGLSPLVMDKELQKLSRYYSDDMFRRGYFSHVDPDGLDPFDRMEKAGIVFEHAGENLALAPSVELAMQGLMNSPGHRKNILSEKYGKVGIGVVDGGIYGKMFTQEFTD
jgi:uncharacterized protein YkwD